MTEATEARIVESFGQTLIAEFKNERYKIHFESSVPGWGIWRREQRTTDEMRDWLDTSRALDAALERWKDHR